MSEHTNTPEILYETIETIAKYHENSKNFLVINGYMSNFLFMRLYDELKNIQDVGKKQDVYVIINSFGGTPEGAYKIIKQIRQSFDKVLGIIPLCANSAATLISLGFDKIYFSRLGEMSPLDMQILKKSEGDKPVHRSALDHTSAIKEILNLAFDTYNIHYKNLPDLKEVDKIKLASDYSSKMVEALLNQVNPLELGNVARSNKVALDYGKRILIRYKKWKEEDAEKFMQNVIHYYPSHSSIIDEEELKKLKFSDVETIDYRDVNFDIFLKMLFYEDDFVKYYSIKPGAKETNKKANTAIKNADEKKQRGD